MRDNFIADYDRGRDLRTNEFRAGCFAPFGNLYFNPLGYVGYCCQNQTEPTAIGHIGKERLDEIWNGRKAQAIRKAVAKYAFPKPTCQHCAWQVENGNLQGVFAKKYDILPVDEQPEFPHRMEFAMSNACNFACTMCNGHYSSLIRKKIEKLPPLPMVYDETFFGDLEKYIPHLRQAAFLGGEPFLAKENYRVWDMFIANQMQDRLMIRITTNGSVLNARVEEVLDKLPCHITISIEGVSKDTQDAIRIGSDLEEVLANVKRFHKYTQERGTGMGFAHCLMVQNWHGFGNLLQFAEDLGCNVFVNSVRQPRDHSLYELPVDELRRIVTRMDIERKRLAPKLVKNREVLERTVNGLQSYLANLEEKAAASREVDCAQLPEK